MKKDFAVLGESLPHTISPAIHETIFDVMNISANYGILEIPRIKIDGLLHRLLASHMDGINITIPYKVALLEELDTISDEAEKIGAINTVMFEDGKIHGHNTDYYGVLESFKVLDFNPRGKTAVVLGNGGASKAVVAALRDSGAAEVLIVGRSRKFDLGFDELESLAKKDILINTTPIGMFPELEFSPVDERVLEKFTYVFDLIYNPRETVFLKKASELGLGTIGGLTMLVHQAIAAEEIWAKRTFPAEKKKEIVSRVFHDYYEG